MIVSIDDYNTREKMFANRSNDHSAIFAFRPIDHEIEDLGFCRKDSILRIFDYV